MNTTFPSFIKGDKVIWVALFFLLGFSIALVYSSISNLTKGAADANHVYYLFKHGLFIFGGLAVVWVFSTINYTVIARFANVLLIISGVLLLLTLFFGVEINDAKRWLVVPVLSITFQPSDLAKIALILYVAKQMAVMQDRKLDLQQLLYPVILPVVFICGLIAVANLSTALLLFVTTFLIMIVGRMEWKSIGILVLVGILSLTLLYSVGKVFPNVGRLGTWVSRIDEYKENTAGGYQIQQAKIAIAQGGLTGAGPANSMQKYVLPSAYSDFIYAILIEEYGLLGGIALLLIYLIFFWRVITWVTMCDKPFGSLLVLGMGLMIFIQALFNMAVSVDLAPVTGVTLPFMSWGGTSLLFFSMSMGIILSVSRVTKERIDSKEKESVTESHLQPNIR